MRITLLAVVILICASCSETERCFKRGDKVWVQGKYEGIAVGTRSIISDGFVTIQYIDALGRFNVETIRCEFVTPR